jgi:hypothetical protein
VKRPETALCILWVFQPLGEGTMLLHTYARVWQCCEPADPYQAL